MKRTTHSTMMQERGEPSYETHSIAGQVEAGPKPGTFTGMASVFGSVAYGAKGPTQFTLDAFDQSIKATGGKFPLLWQHADAQPVGVAWVKSGSRGLEINGQITQNTFGKDVTALLKDGAIDGVSIGFDAEDHRYDKHASEGSVRVVTKAKLHEVSLVTFPADRQARVRQVNSAVMKLDPQARALADGLIGMILGEESAREVHEGRVFSTKNVTKMKEACKVLADLIRTVEPTFELEDPTEPVEAEPETMSLAARMAANELRLAEAFHRARVGAL